MPRIARLPESSIDSLARALMRYARRGAPYEAHGNPAQSVMARACDALIEAAVEARVTVEGGGEKERARLMRRIRTALGYTYP